MVSYGKVQNKDKVCKSFERRDMFFITQIYKLNILSIKYRILKVNDLVGFNQAIFMFKYTHKLLPASFENIFKKLENFERSLNYQLDIFKMCS